MRLSDDVSSCRACGLYVSPFSPLKATTAQTAPYSDTANLNFLTFFRCENRSHSECARWEMGQTKRAKRCGCMMPGKKKYSAESTGRDGSIELDVNPKNRMLSWARRWWKWSNPNRLTLKSPPHSLRVPGALSYRRQELLPSHCHLVLWL